MSSSAVGTQAEQESPSQQQKRIHCPSGGLAVANIMQKLKDLLSCHGMASACTLSPNILHTWEGFTGCFVLLKSSNFTAALVAAAAARGYDYVAALFPLCWGAVVSAVASQALPFANIIIMRLLHCVCWTSRRWSSWCYAGGCFRKLFRKACRRLCVFLLASLLHHPSIVLCGANKRT